MLFKDYFKKPNFPFMYLFPYLDGIYLTSREAKMDYVGLSQEGKLFKGWVPKILRYFRSISSKLKLEINPDLLDSRQGGRFCQRNEPSFKLNFTRSFYQIEFISSTYICKMSKR